MSAFPQSVYNNNNKNNSLRSLLFSSFQLSILDHTTLNSTRTTTCIQWFSRPPLSSVPEGAASLGLSQLVVSGRLPLTWHPLNSSSFNRSKANCENNSVKDSMQMTAILHKPRSLTTLIKLQRSMLHADHLRRCDNTQLSLPVCTGTLIPDTEEN